VLLGSLSPPFRIIRCRYFDVVASGPRLRDFFLFLAPTLGFPPSPAHPPGPFQSRRLTCMFLVEEVGRTCCGAFFVSLQESGVLLIDVIPHRGLISLQLPLFRWRHFSLRKDIRWIGYLSFVPCWLNFSPFFFFFLSLSAFYCSPTGGVRPDGRCALDIFLFSAISGYLFPRLFSMSGFPFFPWVFLSFA